MGVALTGFGGSRTAVIERADRALYRAKRQGLGVALAGPDDAHA